MSGNLAGDLLLINCPIGRLQAPFRLGRAAPDVRFPCRKQGKDEQVTKEVVLDKKLNQAAHGSETA